MRLAEIIEINTSLLALKQLNKTFDYQIAIALVNNLKITNDIVDSQNEKLNKLSLKYGINNGYEYVIQNESELKLYQDEFKALYNEVFDLRSLGFAFITDKELKGYSFDMTTIELLLPMVISST